MATSLCHRSPKTQYQERKCHGAEPQETKNESYQEAAIKYVHIKYIKICREREAAERH